MTFGTFILMNIHRILIKKLLTTNILKISVLSFLLGIVCLSIFGQTPKIYFQSIRQGLPNQYIRCILKDSRGFMWFGTQNGLTRYDGVNFVNYENISNDSSSLSYNNVSTIIEDRNKNLWVGTYGGLNLYNRDKENFTRIDLHGNVVVSSLCEDQYSNIWIGSIGNGLISYNTHNKNVKYFRHNDGDINSINSNHISAILTDNKNNLWVGTWNGLDLLNIKEEKIKHLVNKPDDPASLSDNYVNALFLEHNNTLWIGTLKGGLNSLGINDKLVIKRYLYSSDNVNYKPPTILSLFGDNRNNLWIGVENEGLMRLNTFSGKLDHYFREEGNSYTLNSNTIRVLYIDDLNILWMGAYNRGLNFIDERYNRFELYRKNPNFKYGLCGDDVRGFAEDKQGNVWMATNNGICMFNIKSRQFTKSITHEKGLSSDAATSLVFDSDGNLWVGTWGGGIDRFDKNLNKTGNFKVKGAENAGENKILHLYVGKDNTIWAGSGGTGLFRFDKAKASFIPVLDESKGANSEALGYVTSIFEDSNHNLWVGTAYRLFFLRNIGHNKYSFKFFFHDNSPGNIPSNNISVIYEDSNKNLWIGSDDQGLLLYDKNKNSFIAFRKQEGLPSNSVSGILEDNKGELWISTNMGISRFDASNKKFRNFTSEDGLVSNEFNGGSCLKAKDGEFFFGSSEGFNVFYPGNIKDNIAFQPVCLTDFKLFNKSVPIQAEGSPLSKSIGETQKIILNHKQSSFTIEFVALNYIQGSKSQYSYILEGLENEWNVVGHKNAASYSYVKPGKYLFKVKGSNNDGVWNNTPASLQIVILPPFWQTTWAYAIYLLIFIALIFAFIRYRITRAKQIHLLELNQMKLQFFANISHELRTPLSLILSPIENILAYAKGNKEINGQLELIYRNSNRLFRLVNEIMDFSKAEESKLNIAIQLGDIVKFTQELSSYFSDEALRRQINYQFQAEPASIEAWFDGEKYEKIILNLLSNAFKFTPDHGTILIRIEKLATDNKQLKEKKHVLPKSSSKELLKISVIDNGKGISPTDLNKVFERFFQGSNQHNPHQTGTGIGLSLTKTLVELHHGKIFVTSEQGKETCFTVLMQLGNNHFKKSEILTEPIDISSKIAESHLFVTEEKNNSPKLPQNTPTIMVVEDNYELRKYMLSTLSVKYKILEASDGEMGYNQAVENVPDLIISDIIMPNLSGIELCKQVKGNIVTSHIPIILLTAKTTLEDQINGIETGADAYITKPFNVHYLEVVIKNLIETRQKLFKRFSQEVYILPKEITNNTLDQNFLENIINYVEENILSTQLSVENLASHLLMSRGHVWRKLKSLTGQSTNEFIRTIRLKKAIKLMEESSLNVSEIAYKVGFSSPAYFTKCFREQYGKSPSGYFSDLKKNNDV